MMPTPDALLTVVSLAILGLGWLIAVFTSRYRSLGFVGTPSINPWLFYTGKLSLFFSIGLPILHVAIPEFTPPWSSPLWLSWVGAILIVFGSIVLLASFYGLGSALKYGLPDEETKLITSGLFQYSRNPLYIGLFSLNLGSILFFPCVLNILLSGYCIFTHILMVHGEERFLAERFGQEWTDYTKRVRRYL
jgi:protein-S-isoprenylcysteine O-methyltransferase Ste14